MTRIPPLERGRMAELAQLLERPYNTVLNWQKFGLSCRLSDQERHEVETAVRELLGEVDGREDERVSIS